MKKILIIAGLTIIAASCYNDKGDKLYPVPAAVTCDTTVSISYANDLMPILNANCNLSGCHDAASASGGYDFTKYSAMQEAAANGHLLGDINWQPGFLPMPQARPKLSDCEINKISRWVARGAKNN